jgi:hypothetical protein
MIPPTLSVPIAACVAAEHHPEALPRCCTTLEFTA